MMNRLRSALVGAFALLGLSLPLEREATPKLRATPKPRAKKWYPRSLQRWVEDGPDYYLDAHGSVRRRVAKKPAVMSARQWKKQAKMFRRIVKLNPGLLPA